MISSLFTNPSRCSSSSSSLVLEFVAISKQSETRLAQTTNLPGVRPSSGAATSARQTQPEPLDDACRCHIAAPEDGRTPVQGFKARTSVGRILTLTLSPRRGNHQRPRRKNSLNGETSPAREIVLPLPGGEGRGEGECEFQLISSGLVTFSRTRDEGRGRGRIPLSHLLTCSPAASLFQRLSS